MFVNILKGVVIGIATVIPGVSGGTMALVMGIYQRLLDAISHVTPAAALTLIKSLTGGKGDPDSPGFWQVLKSYDWLFLLQLAVGGALAIAVFSKIISGLLVDYPEPTYGFFLGLIVISAYFPIKMLKKFTAMGALFLAIGVATPIVIAMSVDKDTRIQRAISKAEKKAAKTGQVLPELPAELAAVKDRAPATTSDDGLNAGSIAMIMVAGAIAVTASILPGVSGSFILLLLGLYFPIMAAISSVNIPILLTFGAGCAIGLITITRLVRYLLAHYWNETVCFLIGLMLGSIYGIWPFQESVAVWDALVPLGPTFPTGSEDGFGLTLGAIGAGALTIIAMIVLSPPEEFEAS